MEACWVCVTVRDLKSLHHDKIWKRGPDSSSSLSLLRLLAGCCWKWTCWIRTERKGDTDERTRWKKGGETPVLVLFFCFLTSFSVSISFLYSLRMLTIDYYRNLNHFIILKKKKSISVSSSLVFLLFSFLNQFELKFLFGITFLTVFTYNNHRLLSPKTERNFHKKRERPGCWSLFLEENQRGVNARGDIQIVKTQKNTCLIFFFFFPPDPAGIFVIV